MSAGKAVCQERREDDTKEMQIRDFGLYASVWMICYELLNTQLQIIGLFY